MSLTASPERFAVKQLRAHTGLANLRLAGQDVAVVGAVEGGVVAASAVLGLNVMSDIAIPRPSHGGDV